LSTKKIIRKNRECRERVKQKNKEKYTGGSNRQAKAGALLI